MTTQDLVLAHMKYAKKLAFKRKKTLPKHISIDDVLSAAYLGLTEAASRFKTEKNVSFETYSYRRILGAIDDYLRSLGFSISLDAEDSQTGLSMAESIPAKPETKHDANFDVVEGVVGQAGSEMLKLYFIDNYDLKQIGAKLRVSESRICQLFSKYKAQIRNNWQEIELFELLAA